VNAHAYTYFHTIKFIHTNFFLSTTASCEFYNLDKDSCNAVSGCRWDDRLYSFSQDAVSLKIFYGSDDFHGEAPDYTEAAAVIPGFYNSYLSYIVCFTMLDMK
jgi:hypothetical protein